MGIPAYIEHQYGVRRYHGTSLDVVHDIINQGQQDAFFVVDLGNLVRKLELWQNYLPRVEPFYAVKCNPDPAVLATLSSMGVKFDCASKGEIEMVLSLPNAQPSDIIYANCCKAKGMIAFAAEHNVDYMTFDNEYELYKIKEVHPHAKLVLRIITDDTNAVCRLSTKFGAPLDDVRNLLGVAQNLGLDVVGVSFHVGSGQCHVSAFTKSLESAKQVFEWGEDYGYHMSLLDIGGGFPGSDDGPLTFGGVAKAVGPMLDAMFPHARVIAEPGRYFASSTCTIATQIIAKRKVNHGADAVATDASEETETRSERPQTPRMDDFLYYVNDGVYGSFNNLMFDHASAAPKALQERTHEKYRSTVFGPTCDGLDTIGRNKLLPMMEIGDWMYFESMGAYTNAASSCFNGFQKPTMYYVITETA